MIACEGKLKTRLRIFSNLIAKKGHHLRRIAAAKHRGPDPSGPPADAGRGFKFPVLRARIIGEWRVLGAARLGRKCADIFKFIA